MPAIEIYAGNQWIGRACLEGFDDGMGVAFGSFQPGPRYTEIRPRIVAATAARHRQESPAKIELEARTTAGEAISTGFVQIDDFEDLNVEPETTVQFRDRSMVADCQGDHLTPSCTPTDGASRGAYIVLAELAPPGLVSTP